MEKAGCVTKLALVLLAVIALSAPTSAKDKEIQFKEVNQLPQWTREVLVTPSFECDETLCGWETYGSSEEQIECGAGMAVTGDCNLRQGTVGGLDYAEQFFDLSGYDTESIYLQICYYILTEEPSPAYHDTQTFCMIDQRDRASCVQVLHDADSGFTAYRCNLFEMMGYLPARYTLQIGALNDDQHLTEFRVDDVSLRVEIGPKKVYLPWITRPAVPEGESR